MLPSIVIQPWESCYVLFLVPGVVVWIVGVVWCLKLRNVRGAVLLQVVGALEVALGAGAAYVKGLADVGLGMLHSGSYDPLLLAKDHGFMAHVGLIGFVMHWGLLLVTFLLPAFVCWRNPNGQVVVRQFVVRPGSNSEGGDKPQPELEGRSR